jgi:hypothetical protein
LNLDSGEIDIGFLTDIIPWQLVVMQFLSSTEALDTIGVSPAATTALPHFSAAPSIAYSALPSSPFGDPPGFTRPASALYSLEEFHSSEDRGNGWDDALFDSGSGLLTPTQWWPNLPVEAFTTPSNEFFDDCQFSFSYSATENVGSLEFHEVISDPDSICLFFSVIC